MPFLDLIAPHLELEHELVSAFRQGLRTANFVGGPVVEKFEEAFAVSATRPTRSRSAVARTLCALPSWHAGLKQVMSW